MPTRETLIILKLLESVKDLSALMRETLNNPSKAQKRILLRKIAIVEKRLPRLADEISMANRKPDPRIVTFDSLGEIMIE